VCHDWPLEPRASICDTRSATAQRMTHRPMETVLHADCLRLRVTNGRRPRLAIRAAIRVILALPLALQLLRAAPSLAEPGDGQSAFLRYCAACHGQDASGHGPTRAAFRTPPADLTQLSRRNGAFPREELFAVIEQRSAIAAHGSRALPVWGETFWRIAGESKLDRSPQSRTMDAIVDFLESLQVPMLAPPR